MNALCRLSVFVVVGLSSSVLLAADDYGTKEEAKALVDRAYEHAQKLGSARALKDFTTDPDNWRSKDLYIFALDMQGTSVGNANNAKLVGRNFYELTDQKGKLFIQECISVAKTKGAGWVDYDWVRPRTQKVVGKSSYVRKLDDFDGFVGAGVYR